jgi:hypothetical protein
MGNGKLDLSHLSLCGEDRQEARRQFHAMMQELAADMELAKERRKNLNRKRR